MAQSRHDRNSDLSMDDSLGSRNSNILRQPRDSLDKARHDLLQQHLQQQNGSSPWRRPASPFVKPPKIIRNHGDRSLYVKLSDLPDDLRQQIRLLHTDDDHGDGDVDGEKLQTQQQQHPLEEPLRLSAQPTLEEIQMCYAQIDLALLMENSLASPPVLNIRPRSVSPAKAFQRYNNSQSSAAMGRSIDADDVCDEWRRRRRNDEDKAGKDSQIKDLLADMAMAAEPGTSCCSSSSRSAMAMRKKTKTKTKTKNVESEYDDEGCYDYDEDQGMECGVRSDGKNVNFVDGGDRDLASLRGDFAKNLGKLAAAAAATSAAVSAATSATAAPARSLQLPVWTDAASTSSRLRYDSTWSGSSHVDIVDPRNLEEDS